MPRVRIGAIAQHAQRETHRVVIADEPAQKKRRLVQLGSSPPPFTTTGQHSATRPSRSRREEPESPRAPASPKAGRKRRIVLVRRNRPLGLRCSSPCRDVQATSESAAPAAREPQLNPTYNADGGSRRTRRDLLQRKPQLDDSFASSPIGTFGGQLRSSRSLCSSHIGPSEQASRSRSARTVGLAPVHRPSHLREEQRSRQRPLPLSETATAQKENQAHSNANLSKRTSDEALVKSRRRRTKIQRVRLGADLPSSFAEQPLSDADRQLNSQPDAVDAAADESEISYFPTLRPTRHTPTDSDDSHHDTAQAVHSILQTGPALSIALASAESRSEALDLQGVVPDCAEKQQPAEEGDSSAGLLEVLSQSAIRKLDQVSVAQHCEARSADHVEAQDQVQVDYDPRHFDEIQAHCIATSIVITNGASKRWTSVQPDLIREQVRSLTRRSACLHMMLQSARKPPSVGVVCRDLGLSSSQMLRRPLADVPEFDHRRSAGNDIRLRSDDTELLGLFEHHLRFAGYRQDRSGRIGAHGGSTGQPFNVAAFQQRRQTRRKEVVKVIIPFSEPSLCTYATQARFVTSMPRSHSPPPRPHVHLHDDSVSLIWMQSTAHAFFRALETMVQVDRVKSAQNGSSPHRLDLTESDLYPCPILHYAAHAETRRHAEQKRAPSHVALYVHLDRLEEARYTLAQLELGDATSYRPFSDPSVRLLVTSLGGERLCLL